MDKREIEIKVREKLGEILEKDCSEISDDTALVTEVGMDSLNVIEIFDMIEDTFGISVTPEKFVEMKTIKDIVRIIKASELD